MASFSSIFQKYRFQIILLAILSGIVLISVLLFFVMGNRRERVFYRFPVNSFNGYEAEMHYLPSKKNPEQAINGFVSEFLLGPVALELAPAFPEGTRLRSLMLRGGVLYIDFSREIIDLTGSFPLSLAETLALTEKNIRANYIGINKIVFTIEGCVPGAYPFEVSP